MNILIIEPDRLLAETYAAALDSAGHHVICCAGAQQAIFAADAQSPDVVVLELQLVGHSGVEFLYEFRSYPEWQSIPVIVLSQVPAAEFVGSWSLLTTELGVVDYVYKPHVTLVKLRQLVDNLCTTTTTAAQA